MTVLYRVEKTVLLFDIIRFNELNILFPGKPTPSITWSLSGKILQNRTKSVDSNVVTSKLELRNLSRLHTDNVYTCTASNTNLILPSERRVQLELYCKRDVDIYITVLLV